MRISPPWSGDVWLVPGSDLSVDGGVFASSVPSSGVVRGGPLPEDPSLTCCCPVGCCALVDCWATRLS